MIDLYKREEIDEIHVIYTRMINSMKEEVEVEEILPLKTHTFIKQELLDSAQLGHGNFDKEAADEADDWFLIYPSPKKVLEKLVYNYVTGFLYGALVEGSASEENARMMAMQSATDNAQAMLAELSVEYNRVRQAAITQEITEVIGGAKALKKKKKKQAR
jgi:F-type H+-transporting ATPase subunit gamma